MTRKLLVLVCLATFTFGCGGPFVLLPGGALDGEKTPAPESWVFTDDVKTIQLETAPDEPYSVNLWVIAIDPHLYVHAGANRATWVEHMERDPKVRLQVENAIYELEATRVETQEEFDRFSDAYDVKYGRRPRNGDVQEAYLYRLAPR